MSGRYGVTLCSVSVLGFVMGLAARRCISWFVFSWGCLGSDLTTVFLDCLLGVVDRKKTYVSS